MRALLVHNASVIRGFSTPPEMVERGWAPSPNNLWSYGAEINGLGQVIDVEEFKRYVMPADTAVLSESGINYGNIIYEPPRADLVALQAFARANGQIDGFDIRFDSNDNSKIELVTREGLMSCRLSPRCGQGVMPSSLLEMAQYLRQKRKNDAKARNDSQGFRSMEQHNIEHRGTRAVRLTKRAVKDAGLKRVDYHDIDESRAHEVLSNKIVRMIRTAAADGAVTGRQSHEATQRSDAAVNVSSKKHQVADATDVRTGKTDGSERPAHMRRKRFWELQQEAEMNILSGKSGKE